MHSRYLSCLYSFYALPSTKLYQFGIARLALFPVDYQSLKPYTDVIVGMVSDMFASLTFMRKAAELREIEDVC